MTGLTISRRPAVGDPVAAQLFDDAFDDIEGAFSSIDASNIASNAGITRSQLADRFHAYVIGPICLLPIDSGSDLTAPDTFTIPTAATEFYSLEVSLPAGAEHYICEVQVSVEEGDATNVPGLRVLKNGALIAGAGISMNSASKVVYRAPEVGSDPYAIPFMALRDGDEITLELERASGAGAAEARGIYVTFFCKGDLTR